MTEPKLLGDMTEDMLKKIGAEKLAKAYERITGKPCGCANRRNTLNNIHRVVIGREIPQVARPSPQPHVPPSRPVDEQNN